MKTGYWHGTKLSYQPVGRRWLQTGPNTARKWNTPPWCNTYTFLDWPATAASGWQSGLANGLPLNPNQTEWHRYCGSSVSTGTDWRNPAPHSRSCCSTRAAALRCRTSTRCSAPRRFLFVWFPWRFHVITSGELTRLSTAMYAGKLICSTRSVLIDVNGYETKNNDNKIRRTTYVWITFTGLSKADKRSTYVLDLLYGAHVFAKKNVIEPHACQPFERPPKWLR